MGSEREKPTLVKLGAVWKGTDRNGKLMFTGVMGDARLLILTNNHKERDNQPDMNVFVAQRNLKKDDQDDERKKYGGIDPTTLDDEIPF